MNIMQCNVMFYPFLVLKCGYIKMDKYHELLKQFYELLSTVS